MKKQDIGKSQLTTAIELFLDDKDPISVHSLAGNAQEIFQSLCIQRGQEPFLEHMKATFPNKREKELVNILRQYRNAFKHADIKSISDDAEILNAFQDSHNDHMIFLATYDCMIAIEKLSIEAQVFQAWYYYSYPEKLSHGTDLEYFMKAFPENIREHSRADQKSTATKMIKWAYSQSHILSDPRTDA